jgi:hypothetical protein
MTYTANFVAGYENESGINTYYEPFLIPEKAYPILEDAYCWRAKIRKRCGVTRLGRLRREVKVTLTQDTGAGGATVIIPDLLADGAINVRSPAAPVVKEKYAEIEHSYPSFSIVVGAVTFTDNGDGTLLGVAPGSTINYVTGTITLNFAPAIGAGVAIVVTFAYYPALPVLGLPTRQLYNQINNDQLIAFDQKYSYIFDPALNHFVELATGTVWNTPDYSQFYSTSYWQVGNAPWFWTTNFNAGVAGGDPIRYYDGTWHSFTPDLDPALNKLYSCRILIPYKNRLVALNTWEGTNAGGIAGAVNQANRCRFSSIGNPIAAQSWYTTPGHGGFIDAPTNEVIVGAEFIKDVLVVKFEASSWKLVYTGNNQLPFVWQKINTELGSESTFSIVPFDDGVYSVGNFGITTDDSVSVQRLDTQIPQQVFKIYALNDGIKRVSGVRDYINELVYWAYPDSTSNARLADLKFPNKVLVYNYVNKTFALFNDSFTCFGYYRPLNARTWASTPIAWQSANWAWNSINSIAKAPLVTAGNQDGYVVLLDQINVKNDETLPITTIFSTLTPVVIEIPNHNLPTGSFIKITGIIGVGPDSLNNKTYKVVYVDANNVALTIYNPGTKNFDDVVATGGTYLGGGQVALVNGLNIQTKVFVPTYQQAMQCRLGYMDFFLDNTPNGEVLCDVFVDENNFISMNDPNTNPAMMGSNTLITHQENAVQPFLRFQNLQSKIWHRMFLNCMCQNFFLKFSLSDAQMSDETIYGNDFVMHAMVFYLSANGRLTQ